jgi:hypothetical protein
MKMQFEVPPEIELVALASYRKFESDIRRAITFKRDKELRRKVQLAISKLEETFCPQQKEVNKNAS